MDVYKWYKAERWLYLHHIPILPMVIKASIRILWGGGNTIPGRYWRRYNSWLPRSWNSDS